MDEGTARYKKISRQESCDYNFLLSPPPSILPTQNKTGKDESKTGFKKTVAQRENRTQES